MHLIQDEILAPKAGIVTRVDTGQRIRVIDVEGKQVVDFACFNAHNPREKLSTSYSRTRGVAPGTDGEYVPRDHLQEGDKLMSTICRHMMTIVEETPDPKGVHDCHHRMCNSALYENHGYPPRNGCFEIISKVMAPYGILPEDLPDTLDLFMNYHHDCTLGHWVIGEPVSKAGDYVELEAAMDCLVAISNCPMDVISPVNNYHCTPMQIQVYA